MTSLSRTAGSALGSALVVALIANRLMRDGHPDESVFVLAFAIGAATMALSAVITVAGIPTRRVLTREAARVSAR